MASADSLMGGSSSSGYGSTLRPGGAPSSLSAESLAAAYELSDAATGRAPPGTALPRSTFESYLSWRAGRAKVLRQVPCSLLMYILFCTGIILRARIATSYEFEYQLLNSVAYAGDGYAPSSAMEWYDWVDGTLVQGVLAGSVAGPGRLANGLGLIIGGVRLVQTRRAAVTCPLSSSALTTLYGAPCYGEDTSTQGGFGNATAAAQYNVTSAFAASSVSGDNPCFQLFLNPDDGTAVMTSLVNGLRAADWIDVGTQTASVQIALMNGNANLFGRVELTSTLTLGGSLQVRVCVCAVSHV